MSALKAFGRIALAFGVAPKARAATVTGTGAVFALRRMLGSSSTIALIGGTDANLTVAGTLISATAAIGAATSQTAIVRESSGLRAVEYPVVLTGAVTVPAAPSIALTAGNGQIGIAWADGSTGGSAITGHRLYAGASAGALALVGTIATGSPYLDTGLTNGVARYYALSAVNAIGESALSTVQNATPGVATSATFTMSQLARSSAVYQRTTTTGGGQGKGAGDVPLALAAVTATGPVIVRCRSAADGTTILQAPFTGATLAATGAQTVTITGVDARLGWFYLDALDSTGAWQNGTVQIGMGRRVLFSGQSLATRMLRKQEAGESASAITSLGVTVNPNATIFSTFTGETNNYTPTLSTMQWQLPASNGTYDSTGAARFLDLQVQEFGVNVGLTGHTVGGSAISTWNAVGQTNYTQLAAVIAAADGPGFEAFVWYQGHTESGFGLPDKPYAYALGKLRTAMAALNTIRGSSFTMYVGSIPNIIGGWGTPWRRNRIRLAGANFAAANPSNTAHVPVSNLANSDGVHQTQAGSIVLAAAMARAMRPEAGLTGDNLGPVPVAATRSGSVVTVTYSNPGTALVATGNIGNRAFFFPTGRYNTATVRDANRYTITGTPTIVDATHVAYTLSSDPGDGAVLDFWQNWPFDLTDATADVLRDNRNTDGDGITVGREAVANNTPIVVSAPTPGGSVNAPPGGYVASASFADLTLSSPTYGAEEQTGFGQTLTGGTGQAAGNTAYWYRGMTMEGWVTAPATAPAALQIFFIPGNGSDYIGIDTSMRLASSAGTDVTPMVAGRRYHWAFVIDAAGKRLYKTDVTGGGSGTRVVNNTTVPADTTGGNRFYVRSNAGSNVFIGGSVDEIAVFQSSRYTGSTYTTPTVPFTPATPDIVTLYHLSGDGVDAVGA